MSAASALFFFSMSEAIAVFVSVFIKSFPWVYQQKPKASSEASASKASADLPI